MVPLGWAAQQHAWGPKRVLQLGNIGTAVSFLALPALASAGANFAVCCFFLLGLLQGPFVPAHNEMKRAWVAEGPGKPLALMVIGLGNRVGGALASTVTPILAARFGWRTVAYLYGGSVALFSVVWQCAVSNGPAELMAGATQRERPAEPEAGAGSEKTVTKGGASIFRVRATHTSHWQSSSAPVLLSSPVPCRGQVRRRSCAACTSTPTSRRSPCCSGLRSVRCKCFLDTRMIAIAVSLT